MKDLISSPVCEGVDFSYLHWSNLKTARISVSMFLSLEKETASKNAVLASLLGRSCAKYPDFTSFNKKLYDLYGMILCGSVLKSGEIQILNLVAEFLDDRYALHGEPISSEAVKLLCEVLFRPKFLDENSFEEDLRQEKNQLIQDLKCEYNDKKLYSHKRCQQIMCKNERYSINKLGTIEDLMAITARDVFSSWQDVLSKARVRIGLIGNSKPDSILSGFKEEFSKINRSQSTELMTKIIEEALEQKEVEEKQEITQAKLVMGFRTRFAQPSEDCFATFLMSVVLGGTSHSKLFLNVREKLSLCYYCSSVYDSNKGILMIKSGVKKENLDKAKSEILKQIEIIKNGDVTQEEMLAAKKSVRSSFMSVYDSMDRLDCFYTEQFIQKKIYSPVEFVSKVENISKEEIVRAANALTLDTTYTLLPNT
ncbi:MAG: insulinase family protein [Oscillospiraceae bacterium]|nr:insulinase family protein [Oscillospiraceae bacterium]